MDKLDGAERNWILYDVGNSAFILLVTTIMPIYFKYLAEKEGVESVSYLVYWGYASAMVTILVAILGPLLGVIGDNKDSKKRLFLVVVAVGCIGCFILGITTSYLVFLGVFIIAKAGYSISLIFYDSMLVDVTKEERMDRVSTLGFAWGYVGSCIPFVFGLIFILGHKFIGISFETAIVIAFTISGAWWMIFSLPLLKTYKQINYKNKQEKRNQFIQLKNTFSQIKKDRRLLLFIIGFFFYIDGVYTIMDMATAFGESIGLDSTGLLLALLLTQIVAFPCALIFGRLSKRYKVEKLITVCIIGYIMISLYAVFMVEQYQFWILALCVGMFQGGIQALSRSYYAKIIPKEKSGEYFGILDICGKGAAFIGVTLVSGVTSFTGSQYLGISVIPVIIFIGLIMFRSSLRNDKEEEVELLDVIEL